MNSNPVSTKPQATSINISIPTGESLAERHILIPFSFLLVILFFFFTFCDFKVAGSMGKSEYPGSEQTQKSITGLNFITGTALPMAGVNNELVSGLLGIKNEQAENLQKIAFNIWALVALAAAIGGVYVFWKREKNEALYETLLAATGVIALLMLLSSVSKYEGKIDMGFVSVQTKMAFQFPYWAALLSFIAAGSISFLRLKLKSNTDAIAIPNAPTPIHVNIITKEAGTADTV
jgi:hypothetical protein